MSTFILVPGAGGAAGWFWHRLTPLLEQHGHTVIAVELPGPDPQAGLPEYTALVRAAAAGHPEVVLVAQSMGAFSALPACAELPARHLVLVNAMVPLPGETPGDWWKATGSEEARLEAARAGGYPDGFDLEHLFLHDVPPEALAGAPDADHSEADVAFGQPCTIDGWPDVATTVVAGTEDRLFPPAFQQRVARERLGLDAVLVPGGHLAALSRPEALAGVLLDVV